MIPVICILLMATLLHGCSLGGGKKSPYPRPAALSQVPALRQDFVQEFLQGRWTTARSLFVQTRENLLRQDDFCSVARMYVLAYRLHAYLGVEYPQLLDKAVDFSQQGLNCTGVLGDRETLLSGTEDRRLEALIKGSRWQALHTRLNRLDDPLFVSVYARKAATRAGSSSDNEDRTWALAFIQQAHAVDSSRGWVLFLVQDWKLQLELETDPVRQRFINKRIDTLLGLVTPCTQPLTGS